MFLPRTRLCTTAVACLLLRCCVAQEAPTCRCIPGDECWPSADEWARFNATVGGKLVSSYQLASVCHDPTYDEAACNYVRQHWTQPELHDESSSSIMAAAVANSSCDPFTPRELPCLPGETVAYAVNASGPSDFAETIKFAKDKNLRLVIRNTGHDYLGKSTGAGALSVWTHHMKSAEFLNYESLYYTGRAVKIGAGIQVEEAYKAANAENLLVVGGDCSTVGVAGGYLQGGGHSALSSMYGVGTDNVLEWEVTDSTGRLLTASHEQNPELYWALSGGGGGTYGIVSAVTLKVYPDMPVTGVQLRFGTADDDGDGDAFFDAVSAYHSLMPTIAAAPSHGMAIAEITNSSFLLTPLTLPNASKAAAEALLRPLLARLDARGLAYDLNVTEAPSWLDYWTRLIKPNPTQLVQNAQYGGWLVPRAVVDADAAGLSRAVRAATDAGCGFVSLGLNASLAEGSRVRNSVLPAWREAALNVILTT